MLYLTFRLCLAKRRTQSVCHVTKPLHWQRNNFRMKRIEQKFPTEMRAFLRAEFFIAVMIYGASRAIFSTWKVISKFDIISNLNTHLRTIYCYYHAPCMHSWLTSLRTRTTTALGKKSTDWFVPGNRIKRSHRFSSLKRLTSVMSFKIWQKSCCLTSCLVLNSMFARNIPTLPKKFKTDRYIYV